MPVVRGRVERRRPARLVRSGDVVRPSDPVRRQLDCHARGHGASEAVVASRAGGLPDKVIPGVTGWLVPPGNEEALAGAIGKALADTARLHAMGNAGRALVEKEFSWRAATDRLLNVYGELLAQR